jgi:hypothetical protein
VAAAGVLGAVAVALAAWVSATVAGAGAIPAAALILGAFVVLLANTAAVVRAGTVVAAARVVATVLVIVAADAVLLVLVDTEPFEATAPLGAPVVRVETDEDIVDAALDLAAGSGAADRALGALPVGAALRADMVVANFAANQPVAAIELRTAGGQGRAIDDQPALLAEFTARSTELGRDAILIRRLAN